MKRFVAVKLIKAGMDSKQVLARFNAERQALALMDHPNIAKVLDGGVTDRPSGGRQPAVGEARGANAPRSGVPFFVMELVKGVPITEYCDKYKLTPPKRLGLFVQACQAIQHAHQKGIIHRDIKPSNVLIALYDDKPVVKVIDFGVAKATGGTLTEATIDTGFGGVVGTPQYMSPEQATLNNLDIDTRSDVYALGVLLYELLTGSPPFSKRDLEKKGLLEMLRVVREEEPPRPSTKLSTADALPSLSANRGTEPKKLTGLLRNELDWIVMKALEKDRTRRYETANGFAADVQRYLSGEAVIAHPPSKVYRIRKFVRRNRGQVIAASLVFLSLLAGVVGTTLGLLEARRQTEIARDEAAEKELARAEEARQRGVAEAEKKRADEEKQIAQAVNDFLQTKLLAQADTKTQADTLLKAGGLVADAKLNPTIRELLDRAGNELTEDKIEANFPNQPLVQAQILRTIGEAYRGVGEAATGIPFLTRSLDLFKAKLGPDHPDTHTSMNNLALGYHAAGKLDLALPLFEDLLKLTKANSGSDHPNTLASMNNLAKVYLDTEKRNLALPLFEESFKLRKLTLGTDHPSTLSSMGHLANAYRLAGKLNQALPLLEESFTLLKARFGADHPDTLSAMHNLAEGYEQAGSIKMALPLYEETLKLRKLKRGLEHPETLFSMNALAGGYQTAGKLDLALPLYEETFQIRKAKLGLDHPDTLVSMMNRATAFTDAGKFDLARSMNEEVLKLTTAKLGPDHPNTLTSMNNLAACYWSLRRLDQSVPLFEKLLPLREKTLGRGHPNTLITVANLGVNYKDAGRLAEALPLLTEAYTASKMHPSLRAIGPQLLDAFVKAGKTTEAKKLIDDLLADARKTLPKDSPQLAAQLARFGLTLLELKAFSDAEPILRECLAIREKKPEANAPGSEWLIFNTQSMLGGALSGQKKYADAEPLLLSGYEGMLRAAERQPDVQDKTPGADAARLAMATRIPEALDRLIQLYAATNKPDEVKKWQGERAKYPSANETSPMPKENK